MVWTSYQGVEVVDSESGVKYRHPRLKADSNKLTALEGASLLALADGTLLVVCDFEGCGYNGITGTQPYVKPEGEPRGIVEQAGSLFSHINWKHLSTRFDASVVARSVKPKPAPKLNPEAHHHKYTDAQIKVAIKIWLKWKATDVFRWGQAACDELERLGFVPSISDKWNPDQLGSLVRWHTKKDKFKNIKAGPMDEADQAALEEMVKQSAERAAASSKKSSVANTARITPHKHTPINWEALAAERRSQAVVASVLAAGQEQEPAQEEEQPQVPAPSSSRPTLTFGGPITDTAPDVINVVDTDKAQERFAEAVSKAQSSKPQLLQKAPPVEVTYTDYQHIADLPTGEPVFVYKGALMVGKAVKEVLT